MKQLFIISSVVIVVSVSVVLGMNYLVNKDVERAQDITYTAPLVMPRYGTPQGLTLVQDNR